jgi:hypothetical protein
MKGTISAVLGKILRDPKASRELNLYFSESRKESGTITTSDGKKYRITTGPSNGGEPNSSKDPRASQE